MTHGLDIVFASYNGARTLPLMLAALKRLAPPRRPWRILAVDNASSDETPALLQAAAADLPLIPLTCATPGKMPALKLAAAHVQGDLVVFTDDDIEPDPQWLTAYEAAAEAAGEAVGLFGGPITPTPLEELSPWYEASAARHAELFAKSEAQGGQVDAEQHIFGPNFMIRAGCLSILEAVPPGLGPVHAGGKTRYLAMGEDSMMMAELQRRGAGARYVRAAGVRHFVRRYQTEIAFLLERAERHGRGAALRDIAQGGRSLKRRARVLLQNAPGAGAPRADALTPSPEAFERLWTARWKLGAAKAALLGPL